MGLKKIIVILLLLSQIISMCDCNDTSSDIDVGNTKFIRITNFVGITTRLAVHCRSEEVDIGEKILPPIRSFDYFLNEHSVYTCNMRWPGATKNFKIDQKRAKFEENCWIVKSSGPCLCDCRNSTCSFGKDNCYEWDPLFKFLKN